MKMQQGAALASTASGHQRNLSVWVLDLAAAVTAALTAVKPGRATLLGQWRLESGVWRSPKDHLLESDRIFFLMD